ncbi:MAG: tetratricopeptide repeat protein [Gammaproteobacteria bacterium]
MKRLIKILLFLLVLIMVGLYGLYRAEQSIDLAIKVLQVAEHAYGKNHPEVAAQLNHLAALYYSHGKYTQAEPLFQRSLTIREKSYGPEHPDVAQSLNNLGLLYTAQNRYVQAEPLFKRSLAIREKMLGPEHPKLAQSLNNLATLYYNQKKYTQAEPLYKRSLNINEKVLKPNHPELDRTLHNLANLYYVQGRYHDAEPLLKRRLAISDKTLGHEHPEVVKTRLMLEELNRKTSEKKTASTQSGIPLSSFLQEAPFIVNIPDDDWRYNEINDAQRASLVNEKLGLKSLILKAVVNESSKTALENFFKGYRSRLLESEHDLKIISESETKFLGYDAKNIVYEATQGNQIIHYEDIVLVDVHTIWVIACIGRPDQKDQIKRVFSFFTPISPDQQINRMEARGLFLFGEGKIGEGFKLLKKVTTLEPENPSRRMNYGGALYVFSGTLYRQGDLEASNKYAKEAEVELKAAIRYFGKERKNYFFISHCYFSLGDIYQFTFKDRVKAKEYYQLSLKYFPEHPEAKASLEKLLLKMNTPMPEKEIASIESEHEAKIAHEPKTLDTKAFQACTDCPEMVPIPTGTFRMGSSEKDQNGFADERPLHKVSIGRFHLGKYEVTRQQFSQFIKDTGYASASNCFTFQSMENRNDINWKNPGFNQDNSHPVVCVSSDDAEAYLRWLNKKTGKNFRLPTEAEWEYAARSGTKTERFWGNDAHKACSYANVGDLTALKPLNANASKSHNCSDGYVYTAPTGSFKANAFGLYDMLGNVSEWTCSAYSENGYDGSEIRCTTSVVLGRSVRGGTWGSGPEAVRSALRIGLNGSGRMNVLGFRLAHD